MRHIYGQTDGQTLYMDRQMGRHIWTDRWADIIYGQTDGQTLYMDRQTGRHYIWTDRWADNQDDAYVNLPKTVCGSIINYVVVFSTKIYRILLYVKGCNSISTTS